MSDAESRDLVAETFALPDIAQGLASKAVRDLDPRADAAADLAAAHALRDTCRSRVTR